MNYPPIRRGSLADLEIVLKSGDFHAIYSLLNEFVNQVRYDHSLISEYLISDPLFDQLFTLLNGDVPKEHLTLALKTFTRILFLGEKHALKYQAVNRFLNSEKQLMNELLSSKDSDEFEMIMELVLAIFKLGLKPSLQIIYRIDLKSVEKTVPQGGFIINRGFMSLMRCIDVILTYRHEELLIRLIRMNGIHEILRVYNVEQLASCTCSILVSIYEIWRMTEISPKVKAKLVQLFSPVIAKSPSHENKHTRKWGIQVYETVILDEQTGYAHWYSNEIDRNSLFYPEDKMILSRNSNIGRILSMMRFDVAESCDTIFDLIYRTCKILPELVVNVLKEDRKKKNTHNAINLCIVLWTIPFPAAAISFPLVPSSFIPTILPVLPEKFLKNIGCRQSDTYYGLIYLVAMAKKIQTIWDTITLKWRELNGDGEESSFKYFRMRADFGKETIKHFPPLQTLLNVADSGSLLLDFALGKVLSSIYSIHKSFHLPPPTIKEPQVELRFLGYLFRKTDQIGSFLLNKIPLSFIDDIPQLFNDYFQSPPNMRSAILKQLQSIMCKAMNIFPISTSEVFAWMIAMKKTPQYLVDVLKKASRNFEAVYRYEVSNRKKNISDTFYDLDINSTNQDIFDQYSLLTYCVFSKFVQSRKNDPVDVSNDLKIPMEVIIQFIHITSHFSFSSARTIQLLESYRTSFEDFPQLKSVLNVLLRGKKDIKAPREKEVDRITNIIRNLEEGIDQSESTQIFFAESNQLESIILMRGNYYSFARLLDLQISGKSEKSEKNIEKILLLHMSSISILVENSCNQQDYIHLETLLSSKLICSCFYTEKTAFFHQYISKWIINLVLSVENSGVFSKKNNDLWKPYFDKVYRSLLNEINSNQFNQFNNKLFFHLLHVISAENMEEIGIKLANALSENTVHRETVHLIMDSLKFISTESKHSIPLFKSILDLIRIFNLDHATMEKIHLIILPFLYSNWNDPHLRLRLALSVDSSHLNILLDGLLNVEESQPIWKKNQIEVCSILIRSCQSHRIYFLEFCDRLISIISNREDGGGDDLSNMEDTKNKPQYSLLPLIPLFDSLSVSSAKCLDYLDDEFLEFLFDFIVEQVLQKHDELDIHMCINVLKYIRKFSSFSAKKYLERIKNKKSLNDIDIQLLSLFLNEQGKHKTKKKHQILCLKFLMDQYRNFKSESLVDLVSSLTTVYSKMRDEIKDFVDSNSEAILHDSATSAFFVKLIKEIKPKNDILKGCIAQSLYNSPSFGKIMDYQFQLINIPVDKYYILKDNLLKIFEVILEWKGELNNSSQLFRAFLMSYQGSNSPLDCSTFRCIRLLEDDESSLIDEEYLFGCNLRDQSKLKQLYLNSYTNISAREMNIVPKGFMALLNGLILDPKILSRTIQSIFISEPGECYPQQLLKMNNFGEEIDSMEVKSNAKAYYPAYNYEFILEIIKVYLREPLLLNCPNLLWRSGVLDIAFACLASPSLSVRKLASHVLKGYYLILLENDKKWKYRAIILTYVQLMKDLVKIPFSKGVTSYSVVDYNCNEGI